MHEQTNSFGTGQLHSVYDIKGPSHLVCMCCPTIHADIQAWASNNNQVVDWSSKSENTLVFGCPATEKTISETLKYLNRNDENIYLGGCMARRFDIALPQGVKRLDHIYSHDKIILENKVSYFMIDSFPCAYGTTRNTKYSFYPFSMCHMIRGGWVRNTNSFCSRLGEVRPIPWPRTDSKSLGSLFNDYMVHKDKVWLLIVSDGLSYEQMSWWLELIIEHPPVMGVSFYNVTLEALRGKVEELLLTASLRRHVKRIHIPLYGLSAATLRKFNRSVSKTHVVIPTLEKIRSYGVDIYTDIAVDKGNKNELNQYVDFVSSIGEIEIPKPKITNYMEL